MDEGSSAIAVPFNRISSKLPADEISAGSLFNYGQPIRLRLTRLMWNQRGAWSFGTKIPECGDYLFELTMMLFGQKKEAMMTNHSMTKCSIRNSININIYLETTVPKLFNIATRDFK